MINFLPSLPLERESESVHWDFNSQDAPEPSGVITKAADRSPDAAGVDCYEAQGCSGLC